MVSENSICLVYSLQSHGSMFAVGDTAGDSPETAGDSRLTPESSTVSGVSGDKGGGMKREVDLPHPPHDSSHDWGPKQCQTPFRSASLQIRVIFTLIPPVLNTVQDGVSTSRTPEYPYK